MSIFEAAHKILPPADYVSMIRSLYADRRSMLFGAFGSALAAAVAGLEAGSMLLGGFAILFIAVGSLRHIDMRAFETAMLGDADVDMARQWEFRATLGAAAIALLYGTWCLITFWVVDDAFAELTAASVSVSVLVGVSQRNFAIDRLMTIQVLLIAVPLALGLLLAGNIYYALLTLLLLPFFASLRRISASARAVFLRAVHGRMAASALAQQLDTALETLEHGLLMLDSEGVIEVTNSHALDAFNLKGSDQWLGKSAVELLHLARDNGTLPLDAHDQLLDLITWRANGKVLIQLQRDRFYEATVSSRQGKSTLLFEDVTKRIVAEEQVRYVARHDTLTGLANRTYFAEQVAAALQARRAAGVSGQIALWILDVDDFKHVNDTLGHLAGDRLLSEIGHRLPETLGPETICARLGGDEFIAFHANVDPTKLQQHTDRMLDKMRRAFSVPNRQLAVNVSIGWVSSSDPREDLETLMVKADLAIASAKHGGKAKAVQFHDSMDTQYQLRQRLKSDLRDAIANGDITLVYQPVVDPRQNRIVMCEALARWTHPVDGEISPSVFIPIAEETGLITDLTRAVLAMATRDCTSWPNDIAVAVNISARDFRASDVEAMVNDALDASRLPAHRLEIEVTETAVIEERVAATAALQALCSRGVGVALDDFGTGYSSLSYLLALPLTKLKIDRSFVVGIETDPQALRLLANVAQLGKDLDLSITVEGVETQGQLDRLLSETNVDHIQGFFYGRPLRFDAMTRLLDLHHQQTGRSPPMLAGLHH